MSKFKRVCSLFIYKNFSTLILVFANWTAELSSTDDDDSWDECESESVDGAENGMEDDTMELEDRLSLPPEVLKIFIPQD